MRPIEEINQEIADIQKSIDRNLRLTKIMLWIIIPTVSFSLGFSLVMALRRLL